MTTNFLLLIIVLLLCRMGYLIESFISLHNSTEDELNEMLNEIIEKRREK